MANHPSLLVPCSLSPFNSNYTQLLLALLTALLPQREENGGTPQTSFAKTKSNTFRKPFDIITMLVSPGVTGHFSYWSLVCRRFLNTDRFILKVDVITFVIT